MRLAPARASRASGCCKLTAPGLPLAHVADPEVNAVLARCGQARVLRHGSGVPLAPRSPIRAFVRVER